LTAGPGDDRMNLKRRNKHMKASPMNDEFHDWLDSCPVMWFRGEVTKDHVTYIFETPEEDEDDS
tara:strand:- start:375 stop:566 length:192 start_codon:yes stop_codon:yes gene_type:complete